MDRNFIGSQAPHLSIQKGPEVAIRGIGNSNHKTSEFVKTKVFFLEGRDIETGAPMTAVIEREFHVVDNLRANALIGNDISVPEEIDILTSKRQAVIGSCNVAVPVTVENAPGNKLVHSRVHALSTVTIPARSEALIPIKRAQGIPNRDFLFEPSACAATALFTHIVNDETNSILARNESDRTLTVHRDSSLGTLSELDFDIYFHTDLENRDLALSSFARIARSWPSQQLTAFLATCCIPSLWQPVAVRNAAQFAENPGVAYYSEPTVTFPSDTHSGAAQAYSLPAAYLEAPSYGLSQLVSNPSEKQLSAQSHSNLSRPPPITNNKLNEQSIRAAAQEPSSCSLSQAVSPQIDSQYGPHIFDPNSSTQAEPVFIQQSTRTDIQTLPSTQLISQKARAPATSPLPAALQPSDAPRIPPTTEMSQSFQSPPTPQHKPHPVNNESYNEIVLPNGIHIYGNEHARTALTQVAQSYDIWHDRGFVDLPMSEWMRIPMKDGWQDCARGQAKIYPLGIKDKQVVDETFDELHRQGRLEWTAHSTPFSYPVFVVYKTTTDGQRKGRAVVDIRGLNHQTLPDAYPIPLQTDIISAVRGCSYITVLDATSFFYQWRVHPDDQHKLTVVSHRGQETFKVPIMGFRNSPAYVQRQIDRILRPYSSFARAYIDDMVISSRTLEEHINHLHVIFGLCRRKRISIKPSKAFIGFPNVQLLGQHVNSFGLTTAQEKLDAITKLDFPTKLKDLEKYLGMTNWLCQYIHFYAALAKPLQDRKTALLKNSPKKGNARKSFAARTSLQDPSLAELESFNALQQAFAKTSFLIHFDHTRTLFINMDASKEFGIGAVIFHSSEESSDFPKKENIQPILFLSRLLRPAEKRYWSTELEVAGLVWVIKKIRHMVESATKVVVFTDHISTLGIAKQTSLSSTATDRTNLRLVRASEFFSRFQLEIRHRPGKLNIIPDALSRLASTSTKTNDDEDGELDVLYAYIATFAEFSPEFKESIISGYKQDPAWKHVVSRLRSNEKLEDNKTKLPFQLAKIGEDQFLIYHVDRLTGLQRLCIPKSMFGEIFSLCHDDTHPGYERCFDKISSSFFVRRLSKNLREFLRHCPKCQLYQTKRHKPYGALQPVLSNPTLFHTVTIDFILALPSTHDKLDTAITVTDKFSKRLTAIAGKSTYSAPDWARVLLQRFAEADWGIPPVIISDRDRKFLSDMWREIFNHLNVRLLYSTGYHPQTDGQSERTNQTFEIALRFMLATVDDPSIWPQLLGPIQSALNFSKSTATTQSAIKTMYQTDIHHKINLVGPLRSDIAPRVEIADAIDFAVLAQKRYYDHRHTPLFFNVGDKALIRLHRGYNIPATKTHGPKLSQQFAGPFKVTEKIGPLSYRLDIPKHWKIDNSFTVQQLEPHPLEDDPFDRPRPKGAEKVFVEGDTEENPSYTVEKVINKRIVKKGRGHSVQYLIRWKGCGPEDDMWRPVKELGNMKELIEEYEQRQADKQR